jgi:hypothetical protein
MPLRKKKRESGSKSSATSSSPASISENSSGLRCLPAELIFIIISFLPSPPVPCRQAQLLTDDTYFRNQALFSLSQASSWLRQVVLPYVWQSFEVYRASAESEKDASPLSKSTSSRSSSQANLESNRRKALSIELIKKIEIVTVRDPTRVQTIRHVKAECIICQSI